MIPGLSLINNFVNKEEEQRLIDSFVKSTPKKIKGRNSICRYGSRAPYNANIISTTIPECFEFLLDRIIEKNLMPIRPNSVSVNEYLAGQGIQPHIDSKESGNTIGVLSLGNSATMVFSKGNDKLHVELPPRCLTLMSDECRWSWKHAVEPVKQTRYSVVFRCSEDI